MQRGHYDLSAGNDLNGLGRGPLLGVHDHKSLIGSPSLEFLIAFNQVGIRRNENDSPIASRCKCRELAPIPTRNNGSTHSVPRVNLLVTVNCETDVH